MDREQRIDEIIHVVGDLVVHIDDVCGYAVSDPMLGWRVLLTWQQAHRRLKVFGDVPRILAALDQLETAMDELAHALAAVKNGQTE